MNETDWLACLDPNPMLQFLRTSGTSERKLRLLACACCRLVWDHLPDPRSRRAVEVSELFADDRTGPRELAQARAQALAASGRGESQTAWAAYWAANTRASGPLWNTFAAAGAATARLAARESAEEHLAAWERAQAETVGDQVHVIREVMGNPFRPKVLSADVLAWEGGTVANVAAGIYDDRAFDQMPVLADALEEAGCDDDEVLAHCREGGPHYLGCWVLDAILRRE